MYIYILRATPPAAGPPRDEYLWDKGFGNGIWSLGEWDLGIQDPGIGDLGRGRGQEARSSIHSSNLGVWDGAPGAEGTGVARGLTARLAPPPLARPKYLRHFLGS